MLHKNERFSGGGRAAADEQGKLAARQLLVCISLFYNSVLLSTLAIPIGSQQLPLSWLIGLIHFGALAVLTRGVFDLVRLLSFGLAFSVVVVETATVHDSFSASSLLYIAGIYAPLALTAPLLQAHDLRTIWKHVSILATIITLCGLIQIAGQILGNGLFLDPIRLLPAPFLLDGYNTTYPIAYGNALLKPNGMFLLEPSFFSQMIALGVLSELVFFKRIWLIVLFAVGLAASFSGTGLVILVPALIFVGTARAIFGFTLLATLVIVAIAALGYGDIFLSRATETGETGSSGNQRFVAPYEVMGKVWEENTSACLFGKGAGSTMRMSTDLVVNYPAIPKVAVEYGMLGLIAFALFWASMFAGLSLPRALVTGLLIFYFVASGSFLQPFSVVMTWALTAGFLRKHTEESHATRELPPSPVIL
jgi:hypothetical protein